MGWKWVDDEVDQEPSGRGFGDLGLRSAEDEKRPSTRTVTRVTCRTEEVEPGRFVRKCDHIEEILRDFIGRPPVVVESKSEHTEEDFTDEVNRGNARLGALDFPGFRSDIEGIEQQLFGGIGSFLDAVEESTIRAFKSLREPLGRRQMESAAAPSAEGLLKGNLEQRQQPDHSNV